MLKQKAQRVFWAWWIAALERNGLEIKKTESRPPAGQSADTSLHENFSCRFHSTKAKDIRTLCQRNPPVEFACPDMRGWYD
jgi:hypothetical protein